MRALLVLLRGRRELRLLLGAALVSQIGDWALSVGLAYYIYVLTGSTIASGLMLMAALLPSVLMGSLAGVFADRWDRRRTMIIVSVLMAAGLLPLLLVHAAGEAWVIYLVAFTLNTLEQFFLPTEAALLPHLVDDAELGTANVLNGQAKDVSRLIGSALGGLLVVSAGLHWLVIFDAGSFLFAAGLLAVLRDPRPAAVPFGAPFGAPIVEQVVAGRVGALMRDWREGASIALRHRHLRGLLLFAAVTGIGQGAFSTLFAPFVRSVLHADAPTYGVIVAVQAAGGIVGGFIAAVVAARFSPTAMFAWGSVAFGTIDLMLFCYPLVLGGIWPAIVLMLAVGLPSALSIAGLMTLFQSYTADRYRGRVFGALSALGGAGALVGAIGSGALASVLGILPVICLQGPGHVVIGAWFGLRERHNVSTDENQFLSVETAT
ncbi:MAG: MFS transporter [Jatrophihabitans sp.]